MLAVAQGRTRATVSASQRFNFRRRFRNRMGGRRKPSVPAQPPAYGARSGCRKFRFSGGTIALYALRQMSSTRAMPDVIESFSTTPPCCRGPAYMRRYEARPSW